MLVTLFAHLPLYVSGCWFKLSLVRLMWWIAAVGTVHDAADIAVRMHWSTS
jgi:hypothetical protein